MKRIALLLTFACSEQEASPDAASAPRRGAAPAMAVVATPPALASPDAAGDATRLVCRLPGGVVCCLCKHPTAGNDTCCVNLDCNGRPCEGECGGVPCR